MEVLHLPTQLFRASKFTVVMRRHTLDVADEALAHLRLPDDWDPAQPGPAVLVTGSPGIGKTEAFTVALLRGLLRGEAGPAPPVIIIDKRATTTVIKLRFNIEDGRAVSVRSAHSIDQQDFRASDPDLQLSSTVFIVDPAKKSSVAGSPPDVEARTIVIAPPDDVHYKQFMTRVAEPVALYMRCWTLTELLVARPFMFPETDGKTLVERWVKQGGVPRSLKSDSNCTTACVRTTTTINTLPFAVVEQVCREPYMANVVEGGDDTPNSAVLTYVESEKPFTRPMMGFLSNWVETVVLTRMRVGVLSLIISADADHRVSFGHVFERVGFIMLCDGGVARVGYLPSRSGGLYALLACSHA
jgi:hypothetical protein